MKDDLFEQLKEYSKGDYYPFHMPGHKRSAQSGPLADIYQFDITEIDGFDNLHCPEGIIKRSQQRAAELYGSQETYFLVNGSTAGILSAVSALAGQSKKLVMARNCHKAVYHAAFLNHMELYYVYPQKMEDYDIVGEVSIHDLEEAFQKIMDAEQIQAKAVADFIAGVVITSPTYDGIVSDIEGIAKLVHSYRVPLIVDQAHGAHFGLHPAFPENAVKQGADLVIHSVHKTLPAPTQTALLHRNGELVDRDRLQKYLRIYQSSSPSYILMAGIEKALELAADEGRDRLQQLMIWRNELTKKFRDSTFIKICPFTEPGKLLISVQGAFLTGQELYDMLRQRYHLQMEMAQGRSVTAILSMMDSEEGFLRLAAALEEIELWLRQKAKEETDEENFAYKDFEHPEQVVSLWEAYMAPGQEMDLLQAEGEVVAEFVNLYPPGVPLLVPGERLDAEMIELILSYCKNGYRIEGIQKNKIKVIKALL